VSDTPGDLLAVRGLHLVQPGAKAQPRLARIRAQLQAAEAWVTEECGGDEPGGVERLRRQGEALLAQSRYEDAEEAFLGALETGLATEFFCWQAAVNCHLFLGRLPEAEATAAQLQQIFAGEPDHPVHYLTATQRGAIAAEQWGLHPEPAAAEAALAWAEEAYRWQVAHRGRADGLRAYNRVVALLRLARPAQALACYREHAAEDDFQNWCRQGEHAAAIAALVASEAQEGTA